MSIKLINYDLINRRPQIGLTTGAIKTELREGTAIERLMRRQGLLEAGEQPTFYVAPYSKYINVDDLTNHAPEGTVYSPPVRLNSTSVPLKSKQQLKP